MDDLSDYITASKAAELLTEKLGRPISSRYIHKLKAVRKHQVDPHLNLYHKGDILAKHIRRHKNA